MKVLTSVVVAAGLLAGETVEIVAPGRTVPIRLTLEYSAGGRQFIRVGTSRWLSVHNRKGETVDQALLRYELVTN